ncbi:MAG: dihydrolipoyl dehydrogenase family protein [Kiritimatiellia bacterium]
MSRHLIILGGGSAAITAVWEMHTRGGTSTLIHDGLPLGGCCLHVGCVPSKYLIRAAEHFHNTRHSPFPGIQPRGSDLNPEALFQDIRAKITEFRERNYENPLAGLQGLRMIRGRGRLVNPRCVEVNGEKIRGDAILIATGSRTRMEGTETLPPDRVLRNENFFDQNELPESVLVLGGGYIAVELTQMMARLGVQVTTLQRSAHLLSSQPRCLGEGIGEQLQREGVELVCGVEDIELSAGEEAVCARAKVNGEIREFHARKVLISRGRCGNTEDLGLENAGIQTAKNGFLPVDEHLRTSCPSVYACGDVLGGHMLVYTASAEAKRVVAHLYGESPKPEWNPPSVPWVVFSDPQIAGVGLSAEEARNRGFTVEEAELPVKRWPRFSTANQDFGFLRLFRDPETDTLLGARALCPEAGDLMSELSLILRHRLPLRQIAESVVPYLTLTEGIQRCAAKFYD